MHYLRPMGDIMNWTEIERRLGVEGVERLIREEVRPPLETLPASNVDEQSKQALKKIKRGFSIAFFGFALGFFFFSVFVPDTWWGIVLKFVCFPLAFFGCLALAAVMNRDAISDYFLATQARYIVKSKVMTAIAGKVGLSYIAAPGGAPESLKALQKLGLLRKEIQIVMDVLDDHGGLDESVAAATATGLLTADVIVLGSEEQKARYLRQSAMGHSFEDGFHGERKGISFSAFEWIEQVDEAPDKYHLLVVFKAPYRLSGATQLRSRKTPWPSKFDLAFQDVQLVPEDFAKKFRLRSTDQVEARTLFNPAVVERVLALAHGDPFRAVAVDNHLVIDIVGGNRYPLLDLRFGEWSDETIRQTLVDIADLLDVVDEMSRTFMVKRD